MKKNAFTLIELLAVIVILAIIALIAVPIVINIIEDSKKSSQKESINMYGKAVENAVADYLLKNPNDKDITFDKIKNYINYNGEKVECEDTEIYSSGKIYLGNCTVGGTTVAYTYGKKENGAYAAYNIGDEIEYKGIRFNVLVSSDANENSVTLLKSTSLTVEELNTYAAGHINMESQYYYIPGVAADVNGDGSIGGMAYFGNSNWTIDYDLSDVKYAVDGWMNANFTDNELTVDALGYKSRIITMEELVNAGFALDCSSSSCEYESNVYELSNEIPTWVLSEQYYGYWTMTQGSNSYGINDDDAVFIIGDEYIIDYFGDDATNLIYDQVSVRPVITILKSFLN